MSIVIINMYYYNKQTRENLFINKLYFKNGGLIRAGGACDLDGD